MEYRLLVDRAMRLLVTLLVVAAGSAHAAPEEFVKGHVVVQWRGEARATEARVERRISPSLHLLHAVDDSDAGVRALVARLAADPSVEWVEREHVRRRSTVVTANDPLFGMQWGLAMARLPQAWARTLGSNQVTVAVVDY